VLIVMQSVLTGVLAILIAVNAIIAMCRMNPHRKARKDAGMSLPISHSVQGQKTNTSTTEKLNRDLDNLTPLDARNSLLDPPHTRSYSPEREATLPNLQKPGFAAYSDDDTEYRGYQYGHKQTGSGDRLLAPDNASLGGHTLRSEGSNPSMRAPLLPQVDARWRNHGY